MTLQLELAFGIAYIITAIIGFFLVPWLRSIKAGQSIKRDGPTWHMSKDGTPTMGGLMFIGACVIICFTVGIFAAALSGGLMGFLLYNFNPAKVFMGDTGSLFLGGAIAAMAFAYNMPLILVTLGILYIIEALSDIIQVGYFKATHGKRVFKMAPFHHHLEMGGWTGKKWSEKELFTLYVVVSIVFAVISYFGVRARF